MNIYTQSLTLMLLAAIEQSFDVSNNGSAPFSLDKTFTILSGGAQCQSASTHATFQASFDVSVEAKVSGNIQYGIALEGTLVPPKISDFGLVATLDADLDGVLNFQAQGTVSITSLIPRFAHTKRRDTRPHLTVGKCSSSKSGSQDWTFQGTFGSLQAGGRCR